MSFFSAITRVPRIFARDTRGAVAVEYVLILAGVAAVFITGVALVGSEVGDTYGDVSTAVTSESTETGGDSGSSGGDSSNDGSSPYNY